MTHLSRRGQADQLIEERRRRYSTELAHAVHQIVHFSKELHMCVCVCVCVCVPERELEIKMLCSEGGKGN